MSDWPPASPATDPADDPAIPLLTDRIFLPAVELDTALPAPLSPEGTATGEQAAVAAKPPPASVEEAVAETGEAGTAPVDGEQGAAEAEAPIEVELDRDLVAASDADFDALLTAEAPVVGIEALPAAPLPAAPAAAEEAVQTPPVAAADDATLHAEAQALRAAVLQRVAARLPEQVNAAVRDLMQPAIDQAMAKLGEEAEVALRITLQELVEQALREELQQRSGPRS